jgi:hypothetical protein
MTPISRRTESSFAVSARVRKPTQVGISC